MQGILQMFHVKHFNSAMSYNTCMDKPIKSFSMPELRDLMKDLKQPAFRAQQIFEWLYARNVTSYDQMTDLPKILRENLSKSHPIYVPSIIDSQTSSDGTQKFVISFHDGVCVEMVSIPSSDGRHTVCCSTQAGCAIGCSFCATGKEGFIRNLSAGEIVDQILIAHEKTGIRVSNVVAMGQGEPFLNYDQTLSALRILNNEKYLNIGARHITVSTCGIIPGIEKFSAEPEQFTLAISLHSAIQKTRDEIMPGVTKFGLPELKSSLQKYVSNTNRRVTLEYAMIKNVNDDQFHLQALLKFCENLLCHINLIPLNKVPDSDFQPSSKKTMTAWQEKFSKNRIETTIRHSRGADIAGACGQLKNALKESIR